VSIPEVVLRVDISSRQQLTGIYLGIGSSNSRLVRLQYEVSMPHPYNYILKMPQHEIQSSKTKILESVGNEE
jgi:hypothetical protein